jgi:amidase
MHNMEICFLTATDLTRRIRLKEISPREVIEAHLYQIERVNPKVNAIVTLVPEQALRMADYAYEKLASGDDVGPLHGLPVAHKDLVLTKGIRTTYGSRIFKDNLPSEDALIVQRLKSAGAITIGKTNTPEFGAGSQTYNEVFGETLNPYDITKTCGGSSGGAAVALASGMQPIADGSDMGGSLRNPASFCNVVGFRVSPGRVPDWPSHTGWVPISVQGPMARTVEDAALMLSAIAGPDPRIPISIPEPGSRFLKPLGRDFTGVRIGWSRNLGGLPVDSGVTEVIEAQRKSFESLGCITEDGEPDFTDADQVFKIWRGWSRELTLGKILKGHRSQMKDTLVWDIEQGVKLSGAQVGWAESKRMEIFQRMHAFMETHEFLVCPVSQVPPFDVNERYITEINGTKMGTFIDWMKSCYYITITGHPAISVPCGFTRDGLPVGVQIVGRYRDDFGVLQLAYAFEQATTFWKQRPSVVGKNDS